MLHYNNQEDENTLYICSPKIIDATLQDFGPQSKSKINPKYNLNIQICKNIVVVDNFAHKICIHHKWSYIYIYSFCNVYIFGSTPPLQSNVKKKAKLLFIFQWHKIYFNWKRRKESKVLLNLFDRPCLLNNFKYDLEIKTAVWYD